MLYYEIRLATTVECLRLRYVYVKILFSFAEVIVCFIDGFYVSDERYPENFFEKFGANVIIYNLVQDSWTKKTIVFV